MLKYLFRLQLLIADFHRGCEVCLWAADNGSGEHWQEVLPPRITVHCADIREFMQRQHIHQDYAQDYFDWLIHFCKACHMQKSLSIVTHTE